METDDILISLYKLSGLDAKDLIAKAELGKSSVYSVLQSDKEWADAKPHNHKMEFVRSWVHATRPEDPMLRLEWAALSIQLLLSEEDIDLILSTQDKGLAEPVGSEGSGWITNFIPEIFMNVFKLKRR